MWTCLKRKQKWDSVHREQRGSFNSLADDIEPVKKRSLNLADLRDVEPEPEPEYISNMTIHSWKEEEDSDSDDDLLTMSPTTIERLDRDPSTVDQSPDDPFTGKLGPQDIELSEAMATSAAAISRYDNNFEVLRLSTILGLEMGATVISNLEAIKKEGWLMKVRGCSTRDQISYILQ